MSISTKLDKDANDKDVDLKLYRGMICSLLYLTTSRPYILFSVYLCVHFQLHLKITLACRKIKF